MAQIFISYARPDKSIAEKLADDLKLAGYSVWWDADLLAVDDFYDSILDRIKKSGACIVIWSPASVKSKAVRDEARLALHMEKLVSTKSAALSFMDVPIGFGGQHAVEVSDRQQVIWALEKLGVTPSRRSGGTSSNGEEGAVEQVAAALGQQRAVPAVRIASGDRRKKAAIL